MRFDTNSFVIGIDTFPSITLGNHPDQFEDLKMHNNTEVEGIKGGLDIKGSGTFKFHIEDDKGGVHLIKIPNSKYVPDLRVCQSSSSMRTNAGLPPSTWPSGHMHSGVPLTFTILYLF